MLYTVAMFSSQTKETKMKTYTVTLENFEGRCKRVKVIASNPYMAMAEAHMKYAGWTPVDVE